MLTTRGQSLLRREADAPARAVTQAAPPAFRLSADRCNVQHPLPQHTPRWAKMPATRLEIVGSMSGSPLHLSAAAASTGQARDKFHTHDSVRYTDTLPRTCFAQLEQAMIQAVIQ